MDYPNFNPGYSPEFLARARQLAAAFATRPAPEEAPPPTAAPPNSILTEIGHGLAQGTMVGLPTTVGNVLKAPGQAGDFLYDTGQGLVDRAKARANDPLYQTDSWLGEGAAGVPTALAAMAVAPLAAAAGAPAALGIGAGALAAAGLFGGSAFQDTYEKAKQAGASDADAHSAALQVGAIQGVGQGAVAAVGGRAAAGLAGAVVKNTGAQGVMDSFFMPRLARQLGYSAAENLGVQIPTQMLATGAQSAVERGVGIDAPEPWEAAKASVLPTLAMTTLLMPFGAAGTLLNNKRRKLIADAVQSAPPEGATDAQKEQIIGTRLRAAGLMAREMRRVDPESANAWESEATDAINNHEAVTLDVNFKRPEPGQEPPQPAPFDLQPSDPNAPPSMQLSQGEVQTPVALDQSGQGQLDLQPRGQGQLPLFPRGEEQINVHTPEHYQPESIDVHGIPTPEEAQHLPVEHIDIHSPEQLDRSAQSIDVNAPLSTEPLGGTKGGRGSGLSAEDATAKIEAALREGVPAQGTARDLGLANGSGVVKTTDSGTSYNINKQDRVKWLKSGLGTAPSELVSKLASLEPHALADALQTVWHERGGEAAAPKFMPKIETLYSQLTGKDIREVTPTAEGSRRHFELTAPNAEELAQQQRDQAQVPRETVALTPADKGQITKRQGSLFEEPKPLTKSQQKAQQDAATLLTKEIDREAANQNASEKANGAKPESTTGQAGAKAVTPDTQIRQGQGDAAAGGSADRNAQGQRREDVNAPTPDTLESNPIVGAVSRFGGREFDGPIHAVAINKAIAAGALVRGPDGKFHIDRSAGDNINDLHRRADGSLITKDQAAKMGSPRDSEDLPHGAAYKADNPLPPKAEATRARAADAVQHVAEVRANIERQQSVLETLHQRMSALEVVDKPTREQSVQKQRLQQEIDSRTPELERLQGIHGDVTAAAADVLNGTTPFQKRVADAAAARAVRTEARAAALKPVVGAGAKATEKDRAKTASAQQELQERDDFESKLDVITERLSSGRITRDEAIAQQTELAHTVAEHQKNNDEHNRGLAGLHDQGLMDHLNEHGATAENAMDFYAKNHRDPTLRAVAKLLHDGHPNTEVQTEPSDTFNGARYVPARDYIEVGRGGMNAVTMVHETVHAKVHKSLGDALSDQHRDQATLTSKQRSGVEALRTIQDVMEKFRAKADLRDPEHRLALESEQEFIAEALANPKIAAMLGGRAGLMTRIYNAIARVVGLNERQVPDFQRLMDAAPTLFGDPRRDSLEVFKSALNRPADGERSPRAAVDRMQQAHRALANRSREVVESWHKNNINAKGIKEGLAWVTLNHLQWLFDRTSDRVKKTFPENPALHAKLDALNGAFSSWKILTDLRRSHSMYLVNGRSESNELVRSVYKKLAKEPVAFGQMAQMSRDARATKVHPEDRTLAEAQKRNPSIKPEDFNHPAAKRARETFDRVSHSHPDVIKLYQDILQKHRLDFARYYATTMENTLRVHQVHGEPDIAARLGDLDWSTHRELTPAAQEAKLNGAMAYMQGKINDKLKALNLVDAKGEAAKDASSLKTGVDGLLTEYNRQKAVPYVHLGRAGDYHVGFTVADKPGAWEKVGALVGADRHQGGLQRDWREPIGTNRRVYMRFDSEAALNDATSKLKAMRDQQLFHDDKGEDTFYDGPVIEHSRAADNATPEFVRSLSKRINDSAQYDDETKQQLVRDLVDTYRQQSPETSPLKAAMFSDGDVGSSKDLAESLRDRMMMSNQSLVNARASPRIAEALSGMKAAMEKLGSENIGDDKLKFGHYITELRQRAVEMQTPVNSPTVDKAKGLTAVWRLGMSPAYMAMTMYQPWQMTMPALGARFGMVKAMRTMGGSFGESLGILNALMKEGWGQQKGDAFFASLSNMSDLSLRFKELKKADGSPLLSGEKLDMLEHLQWSGMLNFGQAQQIFRTDPSDMHSASKLIRIATLFPHYAEISNRLTGAMAAYDLARALDKNGKETANSMPIDKAQEFAIQTIRNTDGDHSQGNVARRLGRRGFAGKVTPLVVGFGQYDIQMFEYLARTTMKAWGNTFTNQEARQAQYALLGIAATTSAIAGTLGLPMMGLVTAVANAMGSLFSDSNDTPPDFEHAWRQHLDGMFGKEGGEIVARGLPRLLNIDMSARSGYQDLAPFSDFLTDRRKWDDRIKDHALSFLGPAVGVAAGMATGAEAFSQGDYVKAINDGLPAVARNIAKAYRLSQYGYETQGGNNEIPIPHTTWNTVAQGLGLTSGAKAEQSEQTFQFNTNQQLLQRRQQVIRNAAYRAMDHGEYDKLGDLIQQNIDFAVRHPGYHAGIASGIADRARQRAMGELTGGVLLAPHQYPQFQNFFPQSAGQR